jgi:hypothetical protein
MTSLVARSPRQPSLRPRMASTRSGPAASTMQTGRTGTPNTLFASRAARSCRHEQYLKSRSSRANGGAAMVRRSFTSWYAVSTEDRTINPDLQRVMAKRMGAKTIEVKSSHLSPISHPHGREPHPGGGGTELERDEFRLKPLLRLASEADREIARMNVSPEELPLVQNALNAPASRNRCQIQRRGLTQISTSHPEVV